MRKLKFYNQDTNEFSPNIEENLFDYSTNPAENIDLNYSSRSPLRYPGGKTRGVEFYNAILSQKT